MSRSSLSNLVLRVRVIPCTDCQQRSTKCHARHALQVLDMSRRHHDHMTCIDYVIWNMDGERKYEHGQWGKRFPSFGRWCLLCHLSAWFWGALKKYKFLDNLNPACTVDLHTSLSVQEENLHTMSHFKDHGTWQTLVWKHKRDVPWAADYFTHDSSYYPVLEQATLLKMYHSSYTPADRKMFSPLNFFQKM